jgi:plastocyanin
VRRAASVAAALLALVVGGTTQAAGAAGPAASGAAGTHTVVMENLRFMPETIEIRRGDTVVWVNRDLVPHTATAQGRFDSGNVAPQASWKHVFASAGTLPYICRYHPTMKGQVIVR